MADGVDYPIGQQPEKKVGIGAFVFLMVDWPQVEVCLASTESGLFTRGLASLEIEIGKVKQHYAVLEVEKVVSDVTQVFLKLLFQAVQPVGNRVECIDTRMPVRITAAQLA